jgi:predicted negative regulator of RcsB-dependent stress response
MARKKRRTFQQELPKKEEKPTKAYRDDFQSTVGNKLEDMSQKVEGKGKNIIYAIAALGVLILAVGIYYVYSQRQAAKANTALGKAIETSQAQVTDTPNPANPTAKTFKTEQERANASIAAFQNVVDKYDGEVEQKAKYFIAVNKMQIDRPAAINELTELTNSGGEVGTLSKFALAQAQTGDGKFDEAVALYQELAGADQTIIAPDTINHKSFLRQIRRFFRVFHQTHQKRV